MVENIQQQKYVRKTQLGGGPSIGLTETGPSGGEGGVGKYDIKF